MRAVPTQSLTGYRTEAMMDPPKEPLKGFQLEQKTMTAGLKQLSTGLLKDALMDMSKDPLTGFQ